MWVIRKFKIRRVALLASAGPTVHAGVREGQEDTPQSEGAQVDSHTNTVRSVTQEDVSVPQEHVAGLPPTGQVPPPPASGAREGMATEWGARPSPGCGGALTCV